MLRFAFLLPSVLLASAAIMGQEFEDRYRPRQVLKKPMRAITNPDIASAEKANVPDNELVLGVEINGESRAYRINELTGPSREIINDKLGGLPIAATW